ncbi:hypothetical protein [Dactylosporangium matsuzakiense]|uniref:Uncharacterized protein n=1 Tax=Dactylosporangium matsuzakiense TaxID=53360 RepID=A0A9W6KD43_9ACTN|nr:hypothetical protein [Dactylosporangium matsuzakiense]UWZ45336.1 hypothetical protein Dmats_01915 [Dactylosporangium matsuzakiense]GLK98686.1 hypothetical protein GCM10017581_004270 [Dactylosporangium matsuzakiense]
MIVLEEAMPLQDHGCFLPEDPFALPAGIRSAGDDPESEGPAADPA